MALRVCGTFLSLFLLGVELAGAQVRQVTGRVTSSQTGEGLPEATVAVVGTRIVAQTGADGRYVLNAPDGELSLVIRGIGFKRAQVTLPPEQGTFDVTLSPTYSGSRKSWSPASPPASRNRTFPTQWPR